MPRVRLTMVSNGNRGVGIKKVELVAAAGLMLIGAAPDRPVFEYKGFRAGEVIPEERLAPYRPKPESESKTQYGSAVARLAEERRR